MTQLFTETLQIAMVVRDLDATMRRSHDAYGIGPWMIYEFNPQTCTDMKIDEKPAEFAMRCGAAMLGSVQWELIEPLDDRSIDAEFLAERGEGVPHVALAVPDYEATVADLRHKGHRVLQAGTYHGTTFSYFSTEKDLGIPIEIYSGPLPAVEPDALYPPASESA
ncbi:MAG: glyoxalase [Comamonadaceae bacterium]|nr:MAG: glyoxalase [Comamonadaceae bacterium]